ncbi:MAG: hypothetical protein GYA34_08130 [Chloroflexi bacterium]|nr:hypothetical protein [Chloroflexota bacterium]
MNRRNLSPKEERIIHPWIALIGLAVGILLLLITCLIVMIIRINAPQNSSPTAVVRYIPAPTFTQTISPQNIHAQETDPPLSLGENLKIGVHIRVQGTGGDGLRLRSMPGLSGEIKYLVKDGEELIIDDGPKEIDDYTWWHVTSTTDSAVSGWGVSDYMAAITNP